MEVHWAKEGIKNPTNRLAKAKRLMSKITLVVIRKSANGGIRESKPCHHCSKLIQALGIKRVIYSRDGDCELAIERGRDLANGHLSRIHRSPSVNF